MDRFFDLTELRNHLAPFYTPNDTSNSPTYGQSNSPRQDGRSIDWFGFPFQ
jgi:hypothetical protein